MALDKSLELRGGDKRRFHARPLLARLIAAQGKQGLAVPSLYQKFAELFP
jgi:hypothetical protein